MKMNRIAALIAMVSLTNPAWTAPKVALYPVQTGLETVRFNQGTPTLDLETQSGAVQVTPLQMDHGSLSFSVGVYNKVGSPSANFGVENIKAEADGQALVPFTREELERQAKNRATWAAIGTAMLAGAAAYAASKAETTHTYRSNTFTPWGNVSHVATYTDNSIGTAGAAASVALGGAAIVGIQNRLDYTISNLRDEVVQTTTIDADGSYGGRVILQKFKAKTLPIDVKLLISWNGVVYPFTFRMTKPGQNLPAPYINKIAAAITPATAPTPAAIPAVAILPAPTGALPEAITPAAVTRPTPNMP